MNEIGFGPLEYIGGPALDDNWREDVIEDVKNDLAYELAGETRHYRDIWEKVEDEHSPYCPVSIAASKGRISTCCLCDEQAQAEKSS